MLARVVHFWNRVVASRVGMAAFWTGAALIVSQLIRIFGSLILTRLLAPEMFGIMSIVLAVHMTLALIADVGIRPAIVQSPRGDDPTFLNTAWTLDIARGIIVWLLCVIGAYAISIAGAAGLFVPGSTWASQELPLVLAVATFSSVIAGFQSTNLTTAQRNLEAKRIAVIDLSAQIVSLVATIFLSLLTKSIWPLVFGGIIGALVSTIASHLVLPGILNRLAWDHASIREIINLGRWILISSFFFVISTNLDKYILGAYLSAAEMGIYTIALNLLLVVELLGNRIIHSIALPSLSEFARDDRGRFREQLFRLRLPIDIGFLFAAGALFIAGPTLVETLYDSRYHNAGYMLQFLSFGLLFTRFGILNMAYIALGRASIMSASTFIKFAAGSVLMVALLNLYGLPGVLVAIAVHQLPSVIYMWWCNRDLGLNDWRYELIVIIAWPVGVLAGYLVREIWHAIIG